MAPCEAKPLLFNTAQSAMKLLARGQPAAPPPSFWAPYQQRAGDDGDEELIFHMEPLPDDLEPEE